MNSSDGNHYLTVLLTLTKATNQKKPAQTC